MKSHLLDKSYDSKLGTDYSYIARLYVHSFQPSNKNIQSRNVLKRLRKSKDIIVLKPEKGH